MRPAEACPDHVLIPSPHCAANFGSRIWCSSTSRRWPACDGWPRRRTPAPVRSRSGCWRRWRFFFRRRLIVSSLSARFPEEGGFYIWTKHAFGDWHGFLCAWMYLVSQHSLFPTLLLSGITMASYMFGPAGRPVFRECAVRHPRHPAAAVDRHPSPTWWGCGSGNGRPFSAAPPTYLVVASAVRLRGNLAWRSGSATRFHLMPQANFDQSELLVADRAGDDRTGTGAPSWAAKSMTPAQDHPARGLDQRLRLRGVLHLSERRRCWRCLPPERISILTGLAQAGDLAGRAIRRCLALALLRAADHHRIRRPAQHLHRRQHAPALRARSGSLSARPHSRNCTRAGARRMFRFCAQAVLGHASFFCSRSSARRCAPDTRFWWT